MKEDSKRGVIGAHVPVKGELKNSVAYAKNIGAEAIQIFGSSPLQWNVKHRDEEEVNEFKKEVENTGISQVFLHAPYLVNLASANKGVLNKSVRALGGHMDIAEQVGAVGLIVHIGSKGKEDKRDVSEVVEQVSGAIRHILKDSPGNTFFIMENTAGAGATFGVDAEELGCVMRSVKSPRLKICIDTAHAYASGILDPKSSKNVNLFFDNWKGALGEDSIAVIHANDSKAEPNSNRDRHENIGEGYIGIEGFKYLAQNNTSASVPWILEVPGFAQAGPDKENIEKLKEIFKNV